MSTITITLPTTLTASGSDRTISINTVDWADPQAHAEYLINTALGVIMQRASAGKKDDPEKAAKAVENAIARLKAGIVPAGGGFTKLTPEEYAMKETLQVSKVKFEKGESVTECLVRLATKLTPEPEVEEDALELTEDEMEAQAIKQQEAIEATLEALKVELKSSEVYKTALKARLSKTKTAKAGSLLGKLA